MVNSNNMLNYKVPVNNFIDERISRDEKIGHNKVTGLLRLKNKHMDNISSIRQNNIMRDEEQTQMPKGKSLGNKKVMNVIKEKPVAPTEKKAKNLKSRG